MSDCVEEILLTELGKVLNLQPDQIKDIKNFSEYGMDSLGFALFISVVEYKLDISFEPEELELENFKNFSLIKNFVENKIIMAKNDKNASHLSL